MRPAAECAAPPAEQAACARGGAWPHSLQGVLSGYRAVQLIMIQVFGQQGMAHLQSKLQALEEELGRTHLKVCVSVTWARMIKIYCKPGNHAQHIAFSALQNAPAKQAVCASGGAWLHPLQGQPNYECHCVASPVDRHRHDVPLGSTGLHQLLDWLKSVLRQTAQFAQPLSKH